MLKIPLEIEYLTRRPPIRFKYSFIFLHRIAPRRNQLVVPALILKYVVKNMSRKSYATDF